jgi:tetratricopeptide (TPR) repeat protein
MKRQYDIAVEQFVSAMKDMPRSGEQRLEALYFLGNTYEDSGNIEKAVECYKDIYQAQANYRDVALRIENYYNAK